MKQRDAIAVAEDIEQWVLRRGRLTSAAIGLAALPVFVGETAVYTAITRSLRQGMRSSWAGILLGR